jgi:hypothetical protein
MAHDSAYDVFQSYSWQDRTAVESIAQALRQRGIDPFLDRWYLAPGQPRITALQGALDRCKAVVVLIGPQGMGRVRCSGSAAIGAFRGRRSYSPCSSSRKSGGLRVFPPVRWPPR